MSTDIDKRQDVVWKTNVHDGTWSEEDSDVVTLNCQ